MLIYSIKYLESGTTGWNATLQSFLVYLAFDNILNNIKKLSFSPTKFLKNVIDVIIFKDDGNKLSKN
jgi:hypothetical protein